LKRGGTAFSTGQCRRFRRLGLLGELLLQKCKLLLLRLQQRSLIGLEPRDFLPQCGDLNIGGRRFCRRRIDL
jgi:hypothetical protein